MAWRILGGGARLALLERDRRIERVGRRRRDTAQPRVMTRDRGDGVRMSDRRHRAQRVSGPKSNRELGCDER